MDRRASTDKLEVLGIATGVFLVLVGLGTIAGMPWQTAVSTLAGMMQTVGGLVAIGIGAGIAWFTRTDASVA
jgi:hypothetical protein